MKEEDKDVAVEEKEEKEEEKKEEKEEEENYNVSIEVKKTSKRGFAKFFSHIFRRSATPDSSITKQASEHRPHSSTTKQASDNTQWEQIWIRKEADPDGYFLLQLAKKIKFDSWSNYAEDAFLTAEDASSLQIARK